MKITVLKGPNNLKLDACLLQRNVSENSWSSAQYSFSWTSINQAKAAINWNQPRIYFFCFSYETNIENDVSTHISRDTVKTIGTCNMLSICCCYSTDIMARKTDRNFWLSKSTWDHFSADACTHFFWIQVGLEKH